MKKISKVIGLLILLINIASHATNKTIGVLNFELTDTTFKINGQYDLAEKTRTQSIKPLLVKALVNKFNYKIVKIDTKLQTDMNKGVNYIFSHPSIAAELGKKVDADYIIVGRLHKPSYLFAYLIARIIDVKQTKIIAHHVVEAKGRLMQATRKSTISLAAKIAETIQ